MLQATSHKSQASSLKPQVSGLKFQGIRFGILLFLIACSLQLVACSLLYAQDKLEIQGDLEINSTADNQRHGLILKPQAQPTSPSEGQVYYDNTQNKPYYYDGTAWKTFAADKNVATRIVAAFNSIGSTRDGTNPCLGNGTACSNPKAQYPAYDYTCDGTDDQQVIQRAIDDMGSMPGVVYLLEGTYNISGSINLDNVGNDDSGKAIIGSGAGTVLKIASGAPNIAGVINTQSVNGLLISQLMIDGNKVNRSGRSDQGIIFGYAVSNSQINQAWVENMTFNGISLWGASNSIVSGNHLQSNGGPGGGSGIIVDNGATNNIIFGNNVQSNVRGIYVTSSSSNNIILGNNVQSNSSTGIWLYSSNNNIVSGNMVWSTNSDGIFLSASSNNAISGNKVLANTSEGILVMNSSSNNAISGNSIGQNGQNGLLVSSSSNNNLFGNYVLDIAANYDGIRIASNADGNVISSNIFYKTGSTAGYPINISGSDKNYLVTNFISSWPAGYNRINDFGTNTKYTDKAKITLERTTWTIASSSWTLDAATNPQGYVCLNPSQNTTLTLANGKAAGDLLTIENVSATNTVTIIDAIWTNINLSSDHILGRYDILKLIWNGTRWLETSYVDN